MGFTPATIPSAGASTDGWVTAISETWTRTTNTTFTVPGDLTAQYSKGTRLRVTDTTTKYFVVASSSHAAGTTTVTFTGGSDYVLAANPTVRDYSYVINPQGYPNWFNYAPTYAGFSADPSGGACMFHVVGQVVTFYHSRNDGTSNGATFTITVPIPSSTFVTADCRIINNGAEGTAPGMAVVAESVNTSMTVHRTYQIGSAAWTTSGAKNAQMLLTYGI